MYSNRVASLLLLVSGAVLLCSCAGEELSPSELNSGAQVLAAPRSALTVSLAMARESYAADEPLLMLFVIKNETSISQSVARWTVPMSGIDSDMFEITSNHIRAQYIGRLAKRVAPRPEDFVTLAPGESLTATVDLSSAYDVFQTGEYLVRFTGDAIGNTARLVLSDNRPSRVLEISHALEPRLFVPGPNAFVGCSTAQQGQLRSERSNAALLATSASSGMSGGVTQDQSASTWYATWFGAYSSSNYSTVKNHFTSLANVLTSQTVTFYCDCTDPSLYAWVLPFDDFRIHLCPAFWSAASIGTDSRAGTIIHEISHFWSVSGTADNAYGQAACRTLASSNPAGAVANADSHEYYAEGSFGPGFMITSDRNPALAVNAINGATEGAVVGLRSDCTISNPDCRWSFRNGMIVSDRNPQLAINAMGGAGEGVTLRLTEGCSPQNPDCTWTYSNGMFRSDTNNALSINAWGGAVHNATLRLTAGCTPANPDCTWSESGMMIVSGRNPELAVNAYLGAQVGGDVRLHIACTASNPDCRWSYSKGKLLNGNLRIAATSATFGAGLVLEADNSSFNANAQWTYRNGMLVSDAIPSLIINAWDGARSEGPLALHNQCSLINPDCTFGWER